MAASFGGGDAYVGDDAARHFALERLHCLRQMTYLKGSKVCYPSHSVKLDSPITEWRGQVAMYMEKPPTNGDDSLQSAIHQPDEAPADSPPFSAVLNVIGNGLVLLDDDLRVLFANQEALIALGDGPVRIDQRQLECDAGLRARLKRYLEEARQTGKRLPVIVYSADGERSKLLVVQCLPEWTRGFLLWVSDFADRPLGVDWMGPAFKLTPSELSVVSRLAMGEAPEQIAKALGSAIATVRSHLFRIYDKTDLKSQAQLIRLAHRVPTWRPPEGM